jgi:DNA helicase-2/ATP-dependent DNA helicase PcrA
MFNPRGQDFHQLEVVRLFGGAILSCLDPDGSTQDRIYLSDSTRSSLNDWRASYDSWVTSKKAPSGLVRYVEHWGERNPGRKGFSWPKGVACIDLLYALTHYFPELHNESEGQVYLEVFTRQLTACQSTSGFKGSVVFDQSNLDLSEKSVRDLLADFLGPIAGGEVSVEEEMIESFPRDQLSVLSIHQSKGLEFPMVIVDVGSEFKTNHQAHAFKRFPRTASLPHRQEDLVRSHSELSMTERTGVDRAFDDLIRQYFVAYSRPQDVLLLVGLNSATVSGRIPNLAFGHDRKGIFHWSKITQTQMELI